MKMKDVVSVPSKPSRILRSDFPQSDWGRSRRGPGDDDALRHTRHEATRQPRQIKMEPYLRAKRQGSSSASDLVEWAEAEEEEPPPAERKFRAKGEPDGWEEAEQEAQDFIDAEQEAQRMLGLDEMDDFRN